MTPLKRLAAATAKAGQRVTMYNGYAIVVQVDVLLPWAGAYDLRRHPEHLADIAEVLIEEPPDVETLPWRDWRAWAQFTAAFEAAGMSPKDAMRWAATAAQVQAEMEGTDG